MKAKKKLLALAMSALTGVVTFGLALHLRVPSTVSAEDSSSVLSNQDFTVTNLEDLVNSGTDIRWVATNGNMQVIYTGEEDIVNQKQTKTDANKTVDFTYAMYDTKSADTDTCDGVTYVTKNGTSDPVNGMNINANDYDGNYSFFLNNSTDVKNSAQNGLLLPCVNSEDQVISFNMNYTGRETQFLSRYAYKSDAIYAYPANKNNGAWYGVIMNTGGTITTADKFLQFKHLHGGFDSKTFTKDEVIVEANKLNTTQVTEFEQLLAEGNIINVTYGTYEVGDIGEGNAIMVFRLYNVTKGLKIIDIEFDTGTPDSRTYEETYASFKGALGSELPFTMRINIQQRYDWDIAETNRTPVTIAGVYEPLLERNFDTAIEAGTEDETVETLTLPDGYVAKNLDQVLVGGENTVAATYTYKYYDTDNKAEGEETTYEKDCVITVTAEAAPRYTLTLKDMNGEVIGTDTVKQGEDYEFKALDREKAFVAYKVGDALYNVGDTVAVGADSEATLWEADFKMNEKVSVRLYNNENGEGGLRYMAQMPASDWAVISESVTLKTMIIPTDKIVGDLNADEVGAQSKPATVADMTDGGVDYKIALFAITDIMHMNYDLKFTGAAYLEVTYADGGTDYVMTDTKSVSAYDLAVEAYAANAKEIAENGAPLYHDNDVAILKQYINGVVDISYVVDGDTLTIALAENGLENLDRVYTLDSTKTSVTKNGEAYTVSVTLNVADSVLETLLVDGASQAPVILRNNNAETYTSVAVTREYDATAHTLKLTFDVNA